MRMLLGLDDLADELARQQAQGRLGPDRQLATGAEDRVEHGRDRRAKEAVHWVGVDERGRVRHGLRDEHARELRAGGVADQLPGSSSSARRERERGTHGEGGRDVADKVLEVVVREPLELRDDVQRVEVR